MCSLTSPFALNRKPHQGAQAGPRSRLGPLGQGNPVPRLPRGCSRGQGAGSRRTHHWLCGEGHARGEPQERPLAQFRGQQCVHQVQRQEMQFFSISPEQHGEKEGKRSQGQEKNPTILTPTTLPTLAFLQPHCQQQQKEGQRRGPVLCCCRSGVSLKQPSWEHSSKNRVERKETRRKMEGNWYLLSLCIRPVLPTSQGQKHKHKNFQHKQQRLKVVYHITHKRIFKYISHHRPCSALREPSTAEPPTQRLPLSNPSQMLLVGSIPGLLYPKMAEVIQCPAHQWYQDCGIPNPITRMQHLLSWAHLLDASTWRTPLSVPPSQTPGKEVVSHDHHCS